MAVPRTRSLRLLTSASDDTPPVRNATRSAKLAALPIAYAGRRAGGVGRRALGRPAAEVNLDIKLRTAQHIFEVLGELKGCAVKLGQLMSIFELALPPEWAEPYRDALRQLQDSTPTMLPPTTHAAMAANMGPNWRSHFREFPDRPAAAASIGQVHRAVWRDGRQVAVKVMYPGARESVLSDLRQLRRISLLAGVFVPGADVKGVTEAICACVEQELDYAAEAESQRTFAAAYSGDPDFFVPQVIAQHDDVVVSEWIDGIPVSRIITCGAPEERSRVGLLLLRFVASSWNRSGLLYTDPHPGNFRVMPDGRLGVVDFGACGRAPSPGFHESVRQVCSAVANSDTTALEAVIRRHGWVQADRDFDVEAIYQTLAALSEPLVRPSYRLTTEWLRGHLHRAMNPSLSNVHRQMTMPADETPIARAVLTGIGVLCQLETEGSFRDELARSSSEFAAAIAAFDQHTGKPTDLTIARRQRPNTARARGRFSVIG